MRPQPEPQLFSFLKVSNQAIQLIQIHRFNPYLRESRPDQSKQFAGFSGHIDYMTGALR